MRPVKLEACISFWCTSEYFPAAFCSAQPTLLLSRWIAVTYVGMVMWDGGTCL